MNRVAVASTTLVSVSYFPDRHLLELEFRNGQSISISTFRCMIIANS
jgi:hypothetical protein